MKCTEISNCSEIYTATISVSEYLKDYVDVSAFLKCCIECPHYGKVWSCPPYDFVQEDYWRRFERLDLVAVKILIAEGEDYKEVLRSAKKELTAKLYEMEEQRPGSISLSAGSCDLCEENGCTRLQGEPCRLPDRMRYSIESIGGNVGLTISKLMGLEIQWIKEGKMPENFFLVCGLLS